MKFLYILMGALLSSGLLYAQESCEQMVALLEKEENAYAKVDRQNVAGNEASAAIGRFIRAGDAVMSQCAHALSFENRHLMQKKLEQAKNLQTASHSLRPVQPLRDPRGQQEYTRGVIKTH